MDRSHRPTAVLLIWALAAAMTSGASAQTGAETFSATATVKTASSATATAPVVVTVERRQSPTEADKLAVAYKSGGAAALRKALAGVPPTGSIKLGDGAPVPSRIAIERTTDKGRLLTLVADQPVLFLGAGLPQAKAKEGYDFAVVDLEVDASGNGSGTLAPAAQITWRQGAFVVQDYAAELVRLTSLRKMK